MVEFDYPNTILIMKPLGADAANALRAEHNADRLVSFHFEDIVSDIVSNIAEYDDARSRECTPYVSRPPEPQLHLKFDPKPGDTTRGFIFGSDESKCDIQLLDGRKVGISSQHFCIDFNWNSGFLRLNNISRYGTEMKAPSVKNGRQLLKNSDMHMLHPAEQTKVRVGTLEFELSIPARGKHQHEYEKNWESFRRTCQKEVPAMGNLDIRSTEITRFVVRREGRLSTYLLHDEIGKGGFGTVRKATDHRTGRLFAAKQFATNIPGWDARAHLEIAISQKITHEHIVSFVDSISDDGGPVLVMEIMPLGNLSDLDREQKISLPEMRLVLRQALQALTYLHDQKNITHRDIKPENILVRSRTPEIYIKLCDFGLSTQSSFLKTKCGTRCYAAAEIFTGSYTNSVDVWAIGVIGYQFLKGLPKHCETWSAKYWSGKIRRTLEHADRQGHDPVIRLLKSMLELNALNRPSAKSCLSDPWIQDVPLSLQSDMTPFYTRSRSLKTISEQLTEIWNPPTQMREDVQGPTPLDGSRKRLRYYDATVSGAQSSKRCTINT